MRIKSKMRRPNTLKTMIMSTNIKLTMTVQNKSLTIKNQVKTHILRRMINQKKKLRIMNRIIMNMKIIKIMNPIMMTMKAMQMQRISVLLQTKVIPMVNTQKMMMMFKCKEKHSLNIVIRILRAQQNCLTWEVPREVNPKSLLALYTKQSKHSPRNFNQL